MMAGTLLKLLQDLRASYWFVPALMTLGAGLLSLLTHWFDTRYGAAFLRNVPYLYSPSPDGVRTTLASIAGSMIGVAGVTFSMTIVSVSFAAAQYGPRLVGNFMRDRGNQFTLGAFIAAFVYCLMVLRTVQSPGSWPGRRLPVRLCRTSPCWSRSPWHCCRSPC